MEEKDYALISELVDRLLIGDEEIVRYLFFDKCTPMFNYILHRFCPCQLDKNELINELYLYLQSDNWYKLRQFDFRSKLTTWLTVIKSTENDDKYTVKKKRGTDGLSESIGSNKRRRESF